MLKYRHMTGWAPKQKGFTIVELLIVIVVIAILAAITIVAYTGIRDRARNSNLQSAFSQTSKALDVARTASGVEQYPASLSAASIAQSSEYTYTYQTQDTTAGVAKGFCLTLTREGRSSFITASSRNPVAGSCDGLVGWWNLNGNANDSSGYVRNGAMVGATSTAGQNGQSGGSYEFTAAGSRITVPSTALLNVHNSGEVSYSLWYVFNGNSTGTMLTRGTASGGGALGMASCQYEPAINITNTNLSGCSGSGGVSSYTPDTGWNHLVVSISNSANSVVIYRNGVEIASRTLSVIRSNSNMSGYILNAQPSADFLVIGAAYNDNANAYNNSSQRIDDVRVYSRPLGAVEVQAMFAAGAQ